MDVFDKTLQTTHVWLNELCEEIGPDAHLAWHVLGAVLRATRDRLPMDLAAHFGSQLPLLVRGTYYDRLRTSELPSKLRSLDEFLDGIEAELAMNRPVNSHDATRAVFQILSRHVNRGQIEKVRQALPQDVRHDDPNAPDVRKRPQRYARAGNRRTDPRPKRGKPTTKAEKRESRGKHGGNRSDPGSQAAGKDPTRRVARHAGRPKSRSPMG